MDWKNKRILITGGTGSIGRVLTYILHKEYKPKLITILSHSERGEILARNYFKRKGINSDKIVFYQGDIADPEAVELAIIPHDIIIHLAALKHIDICERDPEEAIRVNIIGSKNVYMAALKYKPEIVLGMSTDKAYGYPLSFYGYTKAIMEKLFTLGTKASEYKVKFCCVRSGNVLGSSGSVTEIWTNQIARGEPITITDLDMTRFWISQDQIARYIISCINKTQGGEIFVPEMGSCSLKELVYMFQSSYKVTGKKPCEKQHEILAEGYSSDTNKWRLTPGELRAMFNNNEYYA